MINSKNIKNLYSLILIIAQPMVHFALLQQHCLVMSYSLANLFFIIIGIIHNGIVIIRWEKYNSFKFTKHTERNRQ